MIETFDFLDFICTTKKFMRVDFKAIVNVSHLKKRFQRAEKEYKVCNVKCFCCWWNTICGAIIGNLQATFDSLNFLFFCTANKLDTVLCVLYFSCKILYWTQAPILITFFVANITIDIFEIKFLSILVWFEWCDKSKITNILKG